MSKREKYLAKAKNNPQGLSFGDFCTLLIQSGPFDGYTIRLYFDEDGDWLAHLIELPNVSAFADTPEAALHELLVAWEGVKESYRKHDEIIPIANLPTKSHVGTNQVYTVT